MARAQHLWPRTSAAPCRTGLPLRSWECGCDEGFACYSIVPTASHQGIASSTRGQRAVDRGIAATDLVGSIRIVHAATTRSASRPEWTASTTSSSAESRVARARPSPKTTTSALSEKTWRPCRGAARPQTSSWQERNTAGPHSRCKSPRSTATPPLPSPPGSNVSASCLGPSSGGSDEPPLSGPGPESPGLRKPAAPGTEQQGQEQEHHHRSLDDDTQGLNPSCEGFLNPSPSPRQANGGGKQQHQRASGRRQLGRQPVGPTGCLTAAISEALKINATLASLS